MRAAFNLLRSSVGQKIVMALSGVVLIGFVVGHMAGNLKALQGAEKFDAYARWLRTMGAPIFGPGQLLWLVRFALLGALAAHVVSATQTWRRSRLARPEGYRRRESLTFSPASRTMRWGGLAVLAFVAYHILHLTLGTVHPDFDHGSPYANVVGGFRVPLVSLAYFAAMVPLAFHLYHGLWSACQTLGADSRSIRGLRRPLALALTVIVIAGFVSVPLGVLVGLVR